MERVQRPFSLQVRVFTDPKTGKTKKIFYVQFRDQNGAYLTAVSSGQTSRARAEDWAKKKLESGFIPSKTNYLFQEYVRDFWDYEKSRYIQGRLARGYSYSRTFAKINAGVTNQHLVPVFGKLKLHEITSQAIDKWLLNEYQSATHSSSTVNKWLMVLRVILGEAYSEGLITKNPAVMVKKVKEVPKSRGILTPEEIRTLFCGDALNAFWGKSKHHYLINLIAASTGMRQGEIRALRWSQIYFDDGVILVSHTWEDKVGLKPPKAGSVRAVPVAPMLVTYLSEMKATSEKAEPDSFIFPGRTEVAPIDKRAVMRAFNKALERAGISSEAQKARNITFHSYRHFFNTYNRAAGVELSKLQKVTGHRTLKMVENYTHYRVEDLAEVREKVTELLA